MLAALRTKGARSMGRRIRARTALLALAVVAASCAMVGVAYGASNHGISGTVYSGCSGSGPWFISSTARTKAGTGAIKAIFTDINDGGLTFKLLDRNNLQIGSQQSWTKSEINIWKTFASSVSDGKVFFNAFRDTNYSCPDNQNNYNFTGTEFY
jgi:hypothetical protein